MTNDSFANAIVISGASGESTSDNVGATSEAGEYAGNGKTVWWFWIAPDSLRYLFYTEGSKIATHVDVFGGDPGSSVSQVALVESSRPGEWDLQGKVLVQVVAGHYYWIRVDSRHIRNEDGTFQLETGDITLRWKAYEGIRFGNCTDCGCDPDPNLTFIGEATIPTIFTPSEASFGDQGVGTYLVRPCRGAWNYGGSQPGWVVAKAPPGFDPPVGSMGNFIHVVYQGAGGSVTKAIEEQVPPSWGQWPTQAAAESAVRCGETVVQHVGGDIKITWSESVDYGDNSSGNPNPTYGLFHVRVEPVFKVLVPGDAYGYPTYVQKLGTNSYRAGINVRSQNARWPVTNAVFTLEASGGIVNPSAALTRSFDKLGANNLSFDYNASTTGNTALTATIKVEDADGNSGPDIILDLTPVILVFFDVKYGPRPNGRYQFVCHIRNSGYGCTDSLVASVTCANEDMVLTDAYGVDITPPFTKAFSSIIGRGYSYDLYSNGVLIINARKASESVTQAIFNVEFTDGPVTHPTCQITVPM